MIKRCTPQSSLISLFTLMSLCALSFSVLCAHNVSFAQEGAEETKRVAVLALRNKLQMSPSEVEYLTGLVRREAAKSLPIDYLVMTQENIISLLPPDKTLEDCSSECEVDTGRLLGARYIITGEVLRFGSSLRLSLRLHDTQTGRLIGSEVAKGKELEELEGPTEGAIRLLLKELTASASPQPTSQASPKLTVGGGGKTTSTSVRGRAKEAVARIDAPAPRPAPRPAPKAEPNAEPKAEPQTNAEPSALWPRFELQMGLATSACAPNGDADCTNFDNNMSSNFGVGDFGLQYNFLRGKSFVLGTDVRFMNFMFTDTRDDFFTYDVTSLSVGAVLTYVKGPLFGRLQVGVGTQSGYGDINEADLSYDAPSTRFGLEAGVRSGAFTVSLYFQSDKTDGEASVCRFDSFECVSVPVVGVRQTGVRFGWVFL